MAYERYPGSNSDRYDEREDEQGRDRFGVRSDNRNDDHRNYGSREFGYGGYAQRDRQNEGRQNYGQSAGQQSNQQQYRRDHGNQSAGRNNGGGFSDDRFDQDRSQDQQRSYGRPDMYGQQHDRGQLGGQGRGQQDYGRQPQGYDYNDRGFFDRAGDEVRSWFGDDDANRRRDLDARYDERQYGDRQQSERSGGSRHDDDYHGWRRTQIEALDRDYDEYRQENRSKFESEFGTWRTQRQTQRGSLAQVAEHMEVVGSDGAHVGTVDKVRGDRIILTKNDQDAGGRHHSIPSRWLQSVADKVTISKSAEEAKSHWRDEERNGAFFNEDGSHKDEAKTGTSDKVRDDARDKDGHVLNRSFSGTY